MLPSLRRALSAANLSVAVFSAAALLAPPAAAQTGPWSDGELIVFSVQMATGQYGLFRVVPETGATALLAPVQYPGGWSGAWCFDSYRGGLLANMSKVPDNPFLSRLWLVAHDGSSAAMPGFTGSLRAMASAGDGRVFFIRHFAAAQGPQTIEYFDASDTIRTLKQADGVTPFQIEVEHLLYDKTTNALIGSSSGWWSATDCAATGSSLYRIPLSADGLRVDGPVTCTNFGGTHGNDDIMTLDHLPGGKILVTIASGSFPSASELLSVDPVTLAYTTWADPWQADINGGVWSARLGKAVLHTSNTPGTEMVSFGVGESSLGTLLGTSLPLPGAGGFSPADSLAEVDVNGPGCDGQQVSYGAGLAGKSAWVPLLGAVGCPDIGEAFTLSINSVVGGAAGLLFVGLSPAALPFKGGTFHVGTVLLQLPIAVGGVAGTPGAGALALPVSLTDPVLTGVNLYLQAGFADGFAIQGVSLTNGLRLQGF
jgi:hypothetical protein